MNRPPEPPPEGVLIESARRDAGLSVREAARRAHISEGWWRQVVKGYQSLSGGAYGVVRDVPADTVAKMAKAVMLAPERLETEGRRPDAAGILRQTLRLQAVTASPAAASDQPAPRKGGLLAAMDAKTRDQVMPDYRQVLSAAIAAIIDNPGVPLTGDLVFPGDPDEALRWDVVAARGRKLYPDQGYSPEEMAEALALIRLSGRRENQGGAAAGLTGRMRRIL